MEGLTISELSGRIQNGDISARALCEYYLERIETYDQDGPAVNAVLQLNPEATADADELDRAIDETGLRGTLHGIPILLKDNIATQAPMPTTAGSLALEGVIASSEAHLVTRLKDAGALILGKTNLSEWANYRSSQSSSGWSSLGGQTRNPYVMDRSPGGSSSGSGVAVACDFCAAAIGTETDGSIVSPAAFNGIVGIKPTVGLISRAGIVPISASQDSAGPMTRTVEDAALLLSVLAGEDPNDEATLEAAGRRRRDYLSALESGGLNGLRIGVNRSYAGFNEQVDRLFDAALAMLQQLGVEIVEPVALPELKALNELERIILRYEFKHGLNQYLESYGQQAAVSTLADIIAFNNENRSRCMPYFGQDLLNKADASGDLGQAEYLDALAQAQKLARDDGIDLALDRDNLDAIASPSRNLPFPIDWATGDKRIDSSSTLAAVAGYPILSLPMGQGFGLPAGLSLLAGAYQESLLLRIGHAFEQTTQLRTPPKFRSTAFTRRIPRGPSGGTDI